MDNFMNTYFGPLGKEYCVYFYALSIITGITFAISLVSVVTYMAMHFSKVNTMFIANSALIVFNTFLAYISNRLLHTMCVNAL
jgi:hypothetical protein